MTFTEHFLKLFGSYKVYVQKNDAHLASAPADLVALKACALASSIIFLDIDFIVQDKDNNPSDMDIETFLKKPLLNENFGQ